MFARYRIVTLKDSQGQYHYYPEYRHWYFLWSPWYLQSPRESDHNDPLFFASHQAAYQHIEKDIAKRTNSRKVVNVTYYDGLGRTEVVG